MGGNYWCSNKKEKTIKALNEKDWNNLFKISGENHHNVLFKANQIIGSSECTILLELYDNSLNCIHYAIALLYNIDKKDELL
ncbi:hypothetical protein ACV303_11445 [Clostridium perfringens]